MVKSKSNTHICSGCIESFDAKYLFVAHPKSDNSYTTLYCQKCLDKLKIIPIRPYHKVKEKPIKEVKKTIKSTTKKPKK